jgi:hypothetical protein
MATPFYILISIVCGFQFLHILTSTKLVYFFFSQSLAQAFSGIPVLAS